MLSKMSKVTKYRDYVTGAKREQRRYWAQLTQSKCHGSSGHDACCDTRSEISLRYAIRVAVKILGLDEVRIAALLQ
jgi:hypothetical protein